MFVKSRDYAEAAGIIMNCLSASRRNTDVFHSHTSIMVSKSWTRSGLMALGPYHIQPFHCVRSR